MKDILSIQALTKGFTRKIINSSGLDVDEQHWVIKDLDLNVPTGKIIALIGGNGVGKTTLFNIISGFVKPDKGQILFRNNGTETELTRISPHRIASLGIGRMFQDNHIFPEMSVLDNMLVADEPHDGELPFMSVLRRSKVRIAEAERIEHARKCFDEMFGQDNPFWAMRDQPAGSLSYGQQRLLGLVRLSMRDYKLLLLDEPTSGVNPEVIETIKKIMLTFALSGRTVLLIEHNLNVVRDIADFCCYMIAGRIALMGTPDDVTGNEDVRRSYIGL
jgi:ABC-type branched-subunit amino acid transport system ATPase component